MVRSSKGEAKQEEPCQALIKVPKDEGERAVFLEALNKQIEESEALIEAGKMKDWACSINNKSYSSHSGDPRVKAASRGIQIVGPL